MPNNYASSILKIDLNAIVGNYNILKKYSKTNEVAAVVKANAYGLGVQEIAPILKHAGCKTFFVATLDEALQLKDIVADVSIAVFNGILPGQEDVFFENNLIAIINNEEQIDILNNYANNITTILHVDTGMNRLGISFGKLQSIIDTKILDNIDIKFVMSHLACADIHDDIKNQEQLVKVKKIKQMFPALKISLSNSYGVFLSDDFHFDILRPGIALYGGNPLIGKKNPMLPVISLTSKIVQIRNIDSDQTVGYGASANVPAKSVIATVPVGYADGYFRSLSNKSYCAINGVKIPVVGRVSMDLITLDITSIKDDVDVGDKVEIIGSNIQIDDIALWAGTISYEVLTNLGSRYKRVYVK